jgi:DNA-binding SARP family transcriptional activator/FixJ family two-component response regulator
MTQRVLISFGNDIAILSAIKKLVPEGFDLRIESFSDRQKFTAWKDRSIIFLVLSTPENREVTQQVSVLHKEFPHFPLLFIAVAPEANDVVAAFKKGVDDILVYPLTKLTLADSLNKLIGLRKKKSLSIRRWWTVCLQRLKRIWNKMSPSLNANESDTATTIHIQATKTLFRQIALPLTTSARMITESVPALRDVLEVKVLGDFDIVYNNIKLQKWPGQKAYSLLAYLLIHYKKSIHKEELMDKFWPEASPASARNSLNVAIHSIRKCLETISPTTEIVRYKRDAYFINPELKIDLDMDQFIALWKEGRAYQSTNLDKCIYCYEKAIALYDGDFMESIHFEAWSEMERESLKETYLAMLSKLSQYYFDQQALQHCIAISKLMLEKDQCLEEVHRRLMECYANQGVTDKAIRQYELCKKILRRELDTQPSESTELLFREIRGQGQTNFS